MTASRLATLKLTSHPIFLEILWVQRKQKKSRKKFCYRNFFNEKIFEDLNTKLQHWQKTKANF